MKTSRRGFFGWVGGLFATSVLPIDQLPIPPDDLEDGLDDEDDEPDSSSTSFSYSGCTRPLPRIDPLPRTNLWE